MLWEQPDALARLTGALALVRQGTSSDHKNAIDEVLSLPKGEWRRTEKLTFLRIIELGLPPSTPKSVCEDIATLVKSWIDRSGLPVTREAIRILARLDDPETVTLAKKLFDSATTQEDQLHYLEMLSQVSSGWTEVTRSNYFELLAMARLTSKGDRFMPPFFDQIIEDALSSIPEIERESWNRLLATPTIQRKAPQPEPRTFIHHWGPGQFNKDDFAKPNRISEKNGLELFRAGQCHLCHAFGETGRSVGPDLSRVGSRFAPLDLLESILDPSATVAEVFRNITVTLDDGSSVTGRLVRDDFRGSTLHLSPNPFAPTETTAVEKSRIVSMNDSPISPMPPALLNGFKREEVIALVQWLVAGPDSARDSK